MIVYLYHFSKPLAHARHYIGFTTVYNSRQRAHQAGRGARILRACKAQGITFRVVRKWYGGRKLEKQLKARKDAASLCPICSRKRRAYKRKIMASSNERKIVQTTVCPTCKANPGKLCKTVRGKLRGQDTSLHPKRRALNAKVHKKGWPVNIATAAAN